MRYRLTGLDCPDCAAKVERAVQQIEGLETATLNFSTLTIDLPPQLEASVRETIARVEPGVRLEAVKAIADQSKQTSVESKRQLFKIAVASGLFLIGLFYHSPLHQTFYSWAEYTVLFTSYLLVGWPVIRKAGRRVIRKDWFDESFLMTVATFGAIVLHQLAEAAGVMLFYAVGEYLQDLAVNRSRRSIATLLNLQPESANLKEDGVLKPVSPAEVRVGATIVVKPGEKVPLDGTVLEGSSYMDTSSLTGESVLRKVKAGEPVLAGMINGQDLLTVKVDKPYAQSSIARIIELVEKAGERKTPTEQFITSFAHYYTPVVVGAAVLLSLIPPLVIPGAGFGEWLNRALILLVISCPCALMVSIPLGYFSGIGGASRHGILVKGANFLEALAHLDTVVFDKTGTLTQGVFQVREIAPRNGFTADELLSIVAGAELLSDHPIAESLRQAYYASGGVTITAGQVDSYQEIPAYGVMAKVKGRQVIAGNDRLLHREEIPHEDCGLAGTSIYVAVDGIYAGYILIADELKADAAYTMQQLRKLGVRRLVMLTGDEAGVAARIAASLGLDSYHAELLPEGKVGKMEELEQTLTNRAKQKLAFVGDGMNDAPVISRADVGIAMGGLGSDAAIEAADVVLMDDTPAKLVTAVEIARWTKRIVWQNIYLALGVKAFFILLGTFGVASIWEAVFADVGVTLLAVLNASRALRFKQKVKPAAG